MEWDDALWFLFDRKVLFVIVFLIGIGLIIFLPKPAPPEVIETTHYYSGRLGMVSYRNSWFGLGGPEATTLSFLNDSNIIEFTIEKYIDVEVGKNYTVAYNITSTIYYNVPKSSGPFDIFSLLARNSTKRETISVIEDGLSIASK